MSSTVEHVCNRRILAQTMTPSSLLSSRSSECSNCFSVQRLEKHTVAEWTMVLLTECRPYARLAEHVSARQMNRAYKLVSANSAHWRSVPFWGLSSRKNCADGFSWRYQHRCSFSESEIFLVCTKQDMTRRKNPMMVRPGIRTRMEAQRKPSMNEFHIASKSIAVVVRAQ